MADEEDVIDNWEDAETEVGSRFNGVYVFIPICACVCVRMCVLFDICV